MKTILIICPTQYGYNTDYYKFCELLSKDYKIFYVGLDLGKPKYPCASNVELIEEKNNKYINSVITLLFTAAKVSKRVNPDKVFLYYYIGCFLQLCFIKRKKIIVDIRTAAIGDSFFPRFVNWLMPYETNLFQTISIISSGLIDYLQLNKKKCHVLPLGADPGISSRQNTTEFNLLYVGTFNNRNIAKTIKGFSEFIHDERCFHKFHYYIIGNGSTNEVEKITKTICEENVEEYISFIGEVRGKDLEPYYNQCNVGVSYVPLYDFFDNQPPTKTFEYLLNSMAVLATPTKENCIVVNPQNGVLLNGDSSHDFCEALLNLQNVNYDYHQIFADSQKYTWRKIVDEKLNLIIKLQYVLF